MGGGGSSGLVSSSSADVDCSWDTCPAGVGTATGGTASAAASTLERVTVALKVLCSGLCSLSSLISQVLFVIAVVVSTSVSKLPKVKAAQR